MIESLFGIILAVWYTTLLIASVSALTISEVELNPTGTDSGNEWVELYSDSLISLEGYSLVNGDGGIYLLNGSIEGYKIITFGGNWLDNSNETVKLYKSETLLMETEILKDSKNNDETWSFCDNNWKLGIMSKGTANMCSSLTPIHESTESTQPKKKFSGVINKSRISKNAGLNKTNLSSIKYSPIDGNKIQPLVQTRHKIILGNNIPVDNYASIELTPAGKTRRNVIYAFLFISTLLIILLALKKL